MTQNFKHLTKTKYGNVYQISNGYPSYKSVVLAYKKNEQDLPLFINLMIHSKRNEHITLDLELNMTHKGITTGTYHLLEHLMCSDDIIRAGNDNGVILNASTSADVVTFTSEAPIMMDLETGYKTKPEVMNTRIEFLKKHLNYVLDFDMSKISDEELRNEIEVVVSEYKEFISEDKSKPHKTVYDLKMALLPTLYPKSFDIFKEANLPIKHRASDVAGESESDIRSIDRDMLTKAHGRLFSSMETFLIMSLSLNTAVNLMGNDLNIALMSNTEICKEDLETLFESTILKLFSDVVDKAYIKVNSIPSALTAGDTDEYGNFIELYNKHSSNVSDMAEYNNHDYKHIKIFTSEVIPKGTGVFMNYMIMDDSVEELIKHREVGVVCDELPVKPVTMYMYRKLYDILRDNSSLVYTIYGDSVVHFRGIPCAFNIGTVQYGILNIGDRGETLRKSLQLADNLYDDSINYLYDTKFYNDMVDNSMETAISGRHWVIGRRSVVNYLEYFKDKFKYETKYDLNEVWSSKNYVKIYSSYKDELSAKRGFDRVNDRMKFVLVMHPDDIERYEIMNQK